MRIPLNHWLRTRPIAHRGLWGGDITENSLSAYKNAANCGFPIEIDLYASKDGVLYSFHDADTLRMTGVDGYIYEKTSQEINALSIGNDQKIPTFDEVLKIAENKVPLLIEIKNQPNKKIVDMVVDKLKNYNGEFAIQSFNPAYLIRLKKLAPNFLRGILVTLDDKDFGKLSFFKKTILKKMLLNGLFRPDFISIKYTFLPSVQKKRKKVALLAWTVTDKFSADDIKPFCDNIIFENFIPVLPQNN